MGLRLGQCRKRMVKKMDVSEVRMLRWMCGITEMDRIRNERIRGTTKVQEITLKWYRHVMRRDKHVWGKE